MCDSLHLPFTVLQLLAWEQDTEFPGHNPLIYSSMAIMHGVQINSLVLRSGKWGCQVWEIALSETVLLQGLPRHRAACLGIMASLKPTSK